MIKIIHLYLDISKHISFIAKINLTVPFFIEEYLHILKNTVLKSSVTKDGAISSQALNH